VRILARAVVGKADQERKNNFNIHERTKMIGRYISEENYHRLGLDRNEEFNRHASKTLLVILEEDVSDFTFTLEQRFKFANNMCERSHRTLDGIVDYAREHGTPLPGEYE